MKLSNKQTAVKYDVPTIGTCQEIANLQYLRKDTFVKSIWVWYKNRTENDFNLIFRENLNFLSKGDAVIPAPTFTELIKGMESEYVFIQFTDGNMITDKIYHFSESYAKRLLTNWE